MSRDVWGWVGLVARAVTGGVWLVAGALKLPDPYESVRAVRAYDLLPEAVVPTVGHLLPVLEVVVGLALLLGLLTRGAAAVSALLFLAFVVGIASAWARGLEIDCGCFGGGGFEEGASAQYPWEIARDLALLLLSLLLVRLRATPWSLDGVLLGRPSGSPDEVPDPDRARGHNHDPQHHP
ncbi:MauE/DoxX family redox-associated membrane protein [Nocardioides abyssi]|uniref:MauE/DoxX family redox-associated membrane protein n=1 Tax=Nocardioides abyssi TaxID=3058370 RepID=A0ABT8EQJ6_9ACTN|nr:MauE/DoxX family redox-associated membrane protein [Nocardioides abyssi]MDN4160409.1 MauE/DoxX family redox-associated membrane protein [Nocardioides abyssi]